MQKLSPQDIWPNRIYEASRAEMQAKIIALKKHRRVHLTDELTLVFENRETLRFQIQEILRVEGISSREGIQAELDVYNSMMPSTESLTATLFIEVTEEARIPEVLRRLVGIEETLSLRFEGCTLRASFEAGRSDGERISAVQYVQFHFDAGTRIAFLKTEHAEVAVDHPASKASVVLTAETLKSLQGDLAPS